MLAGGLGHPEGPNFLSDGRIVYAHSYKSEVGVWEAKRGVGRYAFTGGAPNACMLGSDGYVYLTNCPDVGSWRPEKTAPPSIMRAAPDGKTEVIVTDADGVRLDGPNDLAFGYDGRLYFTDLGITIRRLGRTRAASLSSRWMAQRTFSKSSITPFPTA